MKAVEPYARTAVLRMYGQDAKTPDVCPGETHCDIFQGAAGKTHADKVKNACGPCPMLPTKLDKGKGHEKRQDLVNRALGIRCERESGYPRPAEMMTNVEFQILLLVDQLIASEDRFVLHRMSEGIMALSGLKGGG